MNLKTGILFVIFCVSLGGVIVGQRLQIRSVGFEAAQYDRELRDIHEQKRVLSTQLSNKRDPANMIRAARDAGLPLVAPEGEIGPLPGKKKSKEEVEAEKAKKKEGA
ncbi:MAG: hypothetical protein KDB82_08535 [Planctomycetes bacterium]|nr:hypothetical protein [Planctomycetota bacterium]